MTVAVIGASGQLGRDVCDVFTARGHRTVGIAHDRLDLRAREQCRSVLAEVRPRLVINTAAMHHLDRCEEDPAAAFAVNAVGSRSLALLSEELGFALAHVSTDYVFGGSKGSPYVETDAPRPLNVYGNSKLSGEYFVRAIARRHFIVRVSALFGKSPCRAKGGMNFVQLMLKLAAERGEVRVVTDEVVSPTCTADVADQLESLTATEHYGLYHAASRGSCSWYELAAAVFEMTGTAVSLAAAGEGEFPAKVPRPPFSALENAALRRIGLDRMPPWREGLRRYLESCGLLRQ